MAGAGLLAHGLCHPFGRLSAHFARDQIALEAERGGELSRIVVPGENYDRQIGLGEQPSRAIEND